VHTSAKTIHRSDCKTNHAEVAEMALAHAVGDKVKAAYRRGDFVRSAPPHYG
jgi:hypothetical protein